MKKWKMVLLMAGLTMGLTACSKETATKEVIERTPTEAVEYTGKNYVEVAESDTMVLKLRPDTGTLRWENKETGEYMDSNLADVDGITDTTAKSDIVATYYSGQESDKYGTTATMDSYSYSVETGAQTYEKIDNGIRMVYALGSDQVTYKDFPTYISEERMNDLVLQYLDQKQQKTVLNQYRLTKSGVYSRKATEEHPLSGMAAPELYSIFYEVGKYSYEELVADSEENETTDDLPAQQEINLTMEVTLEGDELMVRIPTGEMSYNEDYPIKSLSILPYFMSSDSKEGYMFVPDGSGALIDLDNTKLSEYQYTARYFGGDLLQNATVYSSYTNQMMMPVYGLKADDHAVLGIIEAGAETATLEAYVNGYFSGVPYSRTSLTFAIREDQSTATYTGATTNYTERRVSGDYFNSDIKIRYKFLTEDEADYSGMAQSYRSYLIDQGILSEKEAEADAPFYTDILGEIDKKQYFLGIPYDETAVLTTFEQARNMAEDMTDQGIKNIKMEYEGISNSGLNQRAVEKVKVAGKLGGTGDLKDLSEYLESIGGSLFPTFKLQTASTAKNLSKSERASFITDQIAEIYDFDLVKNTADEAADYPTYIISPAYISDYVKKFEASYSKLGITNVGSTDFMTFLAAQYKRGEEVSMTNALPAYQKALELLGTNYDLLLSNPMVDAYSQADYLTDIPTGNSAMKTLDAEVPFMQMVLDGCISYSTENLNTSSADIQSELMKATETKSALKFRFMAAETSVLQNTLADDVFMAEYDLWSDKIGGYYEEYNEFYQQVKDAVIEKHELIDGSQDKVMVTYSNGVKVYLNYSEEEAVIHDVSVAAESYVIQ